MPSIEPLRKIFSRPLSSGWKPELTSISAESLPLIAISPEVGAVMLDKSFQQGALAGAIVPDNAKALSCLHLKAYVLDRSYLSHPSPQQA
jgi:hypothetical protein